MRIEEILKKLNSRRKREREKKRTEYGTTRPCSSYLGAKEQNPEGTS